MSDRDRKRLKEIHTFPALVKYLREDLGWPVDQESFDNLDEITFDWEADELGIDPGQAAKIEYIKQLRPLENGQPQGVFFVKFNAKSLPVVALRRLLGKLVVKKRATANAAERPLWAMRDLVFISSYGASDERQLSFAYFQEPELKTELPTLKVLGWDDRDTALQLDRVHDQLTAHLTWPDSAKALPAWRKGWSTAFELRHGEIVTTAKELADQLAALARGIRERANQLLKLETKNGPLRTLMAAFRTALIHDLNEDQFADMYAQTIAYGLLSARITHPDPVKAETLPDLIPVTNPFLKELMETFMTAGGKHRGRKSRTHLDFDELGINDVVDLLRSANMDAVLRNFGADDRKEDPVTYFYEDFLNAYDAKERKRRGVYYTPKPAVSYIVRSAHELLQTEFGIEDGLASTITWAEMAKRAKNIKIPDGVRSDSPFVQILDPATGTATFLVTVIEVIFETLVGQWKKDGLSEFKRSEAWNEYVPRHLLPRIYGYELMMAPYAIAHLKIGLKLFETGYRFASPERARVYLTNALEASSDAPDTQIDALSEALAHEAQAANSAKHTQRFTVVLGNPPYSASVSEPSWLIQALEVWKTGLAEKKIDLNREEWKFLRFGQLLTEAAGLGILAHIINRDFLDGIAKRQMRSNLQETFPHRRVIDLNGDVKGAVADENVFDIAQGVCVAILSSNGADQHLFTSLIGTRSEKYSLLSKPGELNKRLSAMKVSGPYFRWVPFEGVNHGNLASEYEEWTPMNEIFEVYSSGVQTKRDALCVQFRKADVWAAIGDLHTMGREAARAHFELGDDGRDWSIDGAKKDIKESGPDKRFITPILYRPFDIRYTYWTGATKGFLAYPRREVMQHVLDDHNVGMIFNRQVVGDTVSHFGVSNIPTCHGTFYLGNKGQDYFAPLYLKASPDLLKAAHQQRQSNIRGSFLMALAQGIAVSPDVISPRAIFNYI
jgi:hypothetical protein